MNTVDIGNEAETAVAKKLTNEGYRIITQNWKTKFAEIDIVAEKAKVLYFVEVKFRKTDIAGDGFDYITQNKLHHMQRAAEAYVLSIDWMNGYELMAAAVTIVGNQFKIDIRLI